MTKSMEKLVSLVGASSAIRLGDITPLELVADCCSRINRFDSQLQAWARLDASAAFQAAERLTRELAAGKWRGPLHGIPVGIKDIVDVAGLPTRAGSLFTDAHPAAEDATVVARLRAAGAIVLGKTVTTEFACFDPSPTHNPWNLGHTPGGSSSGSAAALAMGMCFGAIGSQTGGSITRPASYCGVAGLKPTFGRVSCWGVIPVSFHLDHVGTMARTAEDCGALYDTIAGHDPRDPASVVRDKDEPHSNPSSVRPPRLGVIREFFFEQADGEVARLTDVAIDKLHSAGATLIELSLPSGFDRVHAMHRRIMAAEVADFHRTRFGAPRDGYGPNMAALLSEGFAISANDLQAALRHQVEFQTTLARTLAGIDTLVTPATPTAAPATLTTTGDPRFNSPWSYAGVPTISIPCGMATGMPIALQMVGPAWSEASLLATAIWSERVLGICGVPPLLTTMADA